MPANAMPSYVPAEYYSWIETAASETGLPIAVVAAQIQDESGFNPDAVSSAGAEGFAQFLPGTYAASGGKGSPFVAQNELQPYINLTNQNLQWSGGNVEQALAAYNAGEGNWQAGVGYADTILANAGQQATLTAQVTPSNINTLGTSGSPINTSTPAQTTSFNPLNPTTWVSSDMWERIGLVVFGALLVLVGVFMLTGKTTVKIAGTAAKAAAVA